MQKDWLRPSIGKPCFKETRLQNYKFYTQEGNPWKIMVTTEKMSFFHCELKMLEIDMENGSEDVATISIRLEVLSDEVNNREPSLPHEQELWDLCDRKGITQVLYRISVPKIV